MHDLSSQVCPARPDIPAPETVSSTFDHLGRPSFDVSQFSFIPETPAEHVIRGSAIYGRLYAIHNLSAAHTNFAAHMDHSRGRHCDDVGIVAGDLAAGLGMDARVRELLRVGGLLHDLGHSPFSHGGEAGLSSLSPQLFSGIPTTENGRFNHEYWGVSLVERHFSPHFENELGDEVCRLLAGRHKLSPLLGVVDRLAYMARDCAASTWGPQQKEQVYQTLHDYAESLVYMGMDAVFPVVATDPEPALRLLEWRLKMFMYGACSISPPTALLNSVVRDGLWDMVTSGTPVVDVLEMGDWDAIARFSDFHRGFFKSGTPVDQQFVPVLVADSNDLSPWGASTVFNGTVFVAPSKAASVCGRERHDMTDFEFRVRSAVGSRFGSRVPPDALQVPINPPCAKAMVVPVLKSNGQVTIQRVAAQLPPEAQTVSVAAHPEYLGGDVSPAEIGQEVARSLRRTGILPRQAETPCCEPTAVQRRFFWRPPWQDA